MKKLFFSILWIGVIHVMYGQQQSGVQITGSLLDKETLEPLPYASILLKGTYHGTVSNADGIFTLFAEPNDTIQFSYVGYLSSELIVPSGLKGDRYALLELLQKETVLLKELKVYPWPSITQLHSAFLDVKLPPEEHKRTLEMQQNLNKTIKQSYENEKYNDEQWRNRQLYEITGQIQPNHLLDPVRWADFIEHLRKNN